MATNKLTGLKKTSLDEFKSKIEERRNGGTFSDNPPTIADKVSAAKSGTGIVTESANTPVFQTPSDILGNEIKDLESAISGTKDAKSRDIAQKELFKKQREQQRLESITSGDFQRGQQLGIDRARETERLRREEIRNKPGEAGQKIESQVATIESRFQESPEGTSGSSSESALELGKIAGEKSLTAAMASDPILRNIRNTISELQTGIRSTESVKERLQDQDFKALGDFFRKIDEEDKAKATTQTERLSKFLTADKLLAIADNPDSAALIISSFPGSDISATQVLGMALVQKQVADLEAKKTLTEFEQVKLDQAKADLSKTIADTNKKSTESRTAEQKNFELLNTMRDSGIISEEQFNAAVEKQIGIKEDRKTELDILKEEELRIKNRKSQLEADEIAGEFNGKETVIEKGQDNAFLGKIGGSLTFRTNNPGAITAGTLSDANRLAGKFGAIPGLYSKDANDQFVLNFKTREDGDNAMVQLLDTDYTGLDLSQVAQRWTGTDGTGHKQAFKEAGFDLSQVFGDLSKEDRLDVARAINSVEAGRNSEGETVAPTSKLPSVNPELDIPNSAFDLTGNQVQLLNFINTGKAPSGVDVEDFSKRANKFQEKFREKTKQFDDEFRILKGNMQLGTGVSDEDRNVKFSNMYEAMLKGDSELVKRIARNGIIQGSEQEGRYDRLNGQVNLLENIKRKLSDLKTKKIDLGRVTQGFEKTAQVLGSTTNPDLLELQSLMNAAIAETTKDIFGGNASEGDRAAIKDIFGNIGTEIDSNFTRLNALQDISRLKRDIPIRRELGKDFNLIFGKDFFDPLIPSLSKSKSLVESDIEIFNNSGNQLQNAGITQDEDAEADTIFN